VGRSWWRSGRASTTFVRVSGTMAGHLSEVRPDPGHLSEIRPDTGHFHVSRLLTPGGCKSFPIRIPVPYAAGPYRGPYLVGRPWARSGPAS
jgi:hypothetical protein